MVMPFGFFSKIISVNIKLRILRGLLLLLFQRPFGLPGLLPLSFAPQITPQPPPPKSKSWLWADKIVSKQMCSCIIICTCEASTKTNRKELVGMVGWTQVLLSSTSSCRLRGRGGKPVSGEAHHQTTSTSKHQTNANLN